MEKLVSHDSMLVVLLHHNPVNHLSWVEIIPIVNSIPWNAAQMPMLSYLLLMTHMSLLIT